MKNEKVSAVISDNDDDNFYFGNHYDNVIITTICPLCESDM
jgi:hypothetical protein